MNDVMREFAKMMERQVFDAFGIGNTHTSTTADEAPGLTLEGLLRTRALMLPEVEYKTSEFVPIVDSEGKKCLWVIAKEARMPGWPGSNGPNVKRDLVLIHPANLPDLEALCRGRVKLVSFGIDSEP